MSGLPFNLGWASAGYDYKETIPSDECYSLPDSQYPEAKELNMGAATAERSKEVTKDSKDKAEPRTKTNYVVLRVQDDQVVPIGEGEGLNDVQAIGEVAGREGIEEGSFVAVPARSWRVRVVAVQTQRRVSVK